MKNVTKSVIMFSLGSLLALAASAKSLEAEYLESCRREAGVPVPVTVVSPVVAPQYAGQLVRVEFTVNASGLPVAPTVVSATDAALSSAVITAVKQWRFAPALENGVAVETKVVLPIRIVGSSNTAGLFAAN